MYVAAEHGLDPLLAVRAPARTLPFPMNAPHSLYFYRARNAIYHLFGALGFGAGDVVLVPDYHNTNEVEAIRAAGAGLRFYRVRRDLDIDLDHVADLCRSERPRALFIIHYFGWPQPMAELGKLCERHGLLLVEDCALALLSEAEGQPLGSFGHYSTFCLYKTLPVPDGGVLADNTQTLTALDTLPLRRCGTASLAGRTLELVLETVRARAPRLGQAGFAMKQAVGRGIRRMGVPRVPFGDIGFDLDSVDVAMSPVSFSLLGRFDYEEIRGRRRANYARLRERLVPAAAVLPRPLGPGTCPNIFPLLVPSKRAACAALRGRGVAAMEFWNDGVPDAAGPDHADARYLREHLVELPIHQDVTAAQIDYIADQVLDLRVHF